MILSRNTIGDLLPFAMASHITTPRVSTVSYFQHNFLHLSPCGVGEPFFVQHVHVNKKKIKTRH